jgi:uncharacterized protein (TIGR02118 family)
MIKLIAVVQKRPEISAGDFSKYWKDIPGSLFIKDNPTIKRYVQNHFIKDAGYDFWSDGIIEVWLDIPEDFSKTNFDMSVVTKYLGLGADWAKIGVISPLKVWVAQEHVIKDTGVAGKIKTMSLVHKRADIGSREFYKYWKDVHGPFVAKYIPYLLKYVQNHFITIPGVEHEGDGIIETWYDDVESFQKSFAFNKTPEAKKLGLEEDWAKIAGRPAKSNAKPMMWVATEHVIKD